MILSVWPKDAESSKMPKSLMTGYLLVQDLANRVLMMTRASLKHPETPRPATSWSSISVTLLSSISSRAVAAVLLIQLPGPWQQETGQGRRWWGPGKERTRPGRSDTRDEGILKHDQGHLLHARHTGPRNSETQPGWPARPMGQGDLIHDRHTGQSNS